MVETGEGEIQDKPKGRFKRITKRIRATKEKLRHKSAKELAARAASGAVVAGVGLAVAKSGQDIAHSGGMPGVSDGTFEGVNTAVLAGSGIIGVKMAAGSIAEAVRRSGRKIKDKIRPNENEAIKNATPVTSSPLPKS